MTDRFPADPPSPFVVQAATGLFQQLPMPRRALDVAIGRGRHALALARIGWRVFGVDADRHAIRLAINRAAAEGFVVRGWCEELAAGSLPRDAFELLVVTRYLQRELFDSIRSAVVPGGVVIYETFTVEQRALGRGPRSPDHLLWPGELRARFDGFEILSYEEVIGAEAVARLVARRRI